MIKCDKGTVEIEGKCSLVKAEAVSILRAFKEIMGERSLEQIIELSRMSTKDIEKEYEELVNMKQLLKEMFDLFFDEKDGE